MIMGAINQIIIYYIHGLTYKILLYFLELFTKINIYYSICFEVKCLIRLALSFNLLKHSPHWKSFSLL